MTDRQTDRLYMDVDPGETGGGEVTPKSEVKETLIIGVSLPKFLF